MKASDPMFGTAADYNKAMKAAHPEYKVVPYQTAQASAAIYVWKDAFERAQSLDQEKVREALTKTDLPTFYGHVKFAADGSNPGKEIVMRQIQGGKYMVVSPAKVAAASADLSARRALLSSDGSGRSRLPASAYAGRRPDRERDGRRPFASFA